MTHKETGLEKAALRIIAIYGIIHTVYLVLIDVLFETTSSLSAYAIKGFALLGGLILITIYAFRQLRRTLGPRLRYWHSFVVCFSILLLGNIGFRVYCLARFTTGEVGFLAQNYFRIVLKFIITDTVFSAIMAFFFREGKKSPGTPKEIEDMFDIELDLQKRERDAR